MCVVSALRVLWAAVGASPRALRGARRRTGAGASTLDPRAASFLPAGESSEQGVSWKVRGGTAARLSPEQAPLLRSLPAAGSREGVLLISAYAVPPGLGRLRQETFRRARTRTALSGPLHASRRHLQPSSRRGYRYPRRVSLEGLCPPQQAPHHDALSRRVPAAVPAACSPQGLPAHSLLRLARPSPARCAASGLPRAIGGRTSADSNNVCSYIHPAALSLLSGTHARDRAAHRTATPGGGAAP